MIAGLEKAFGFEVRANYMDGDYVAHAELAGRNYCERRSSLRA
jgi:hypothetical protein